MELIMLRLRELGFKVDITTKIHNNNNTFQTYIKAEKDGGTIGMAPIFHSSIIIPEKRLLETLTKLEERIEQINGDLKLNPEKRNYKEFNKMGINWVPHGDIVGPDATPYPFGFGGTL